MALSLKKEYRFLGGKPVLALALAPFVDFHGIRRIIVTVPHDHVEKAKSLLVPHVPLDRVTFVEGGETRQESVMRALAALQSDPPWGVLVHDGARPWVSLELIVRVIESVKLYGACVPVVEVPEAVKQVGGEGFVVRHVDRQTVFFAQTPQGFEYARLFSAHRKASERGIRCVDDAELYDMYEGAVATVAGEIENRKITYAHDLP
jgi:2-C-methyl-D-erythritol 4-phosphate cytidylyltransferase